LTDDDEEFSFVSLIITIIATTMAARKPPIMKFISFAGAKLKMPLKKSELQKVDM